MVKTCSYNPGDYVVYPTHGVGKISSIGKYVVAGQEIDCIFVDYDKEHMSLKVPLSAVESSGLRKLSSEKTMTAALTTLKGKPKSKRMVWPRRAQEYNAKINSGNLVSVAEVVRDLYRSSEQSEQSHSERLVYEAALDRLVSEYAAMAKIDAKDATDRIVKIIHSDV